MGRLRSVLRTMEFEPIRDLILSLVLMVLIVIASIVGLYRLPREIREMRAEQTSQAVVVGPNELQK